MLLHTSPAAYAGNLAQVLRERSQRQPQDVVFTFLPDQGDPVSLSFEALDKKAESISRWLRANKMGHERAILLFPPGCEYITALFGCFYGGAVAVPAYPPTNHNLSVLRSIVADAEAKMILCSSPIFARKEQILSRAPELIRCTWLNTEEICDDSCTSGENPEQLEPGLAYLQYSSGSTGSPKGVMVRHANVMNNLAFLQQRCEQSSETIEVSWLPPYHDLGLVGGILLPVYAGFKSILMSPVSFAQNPVRWLRAITDYEATTSGGPNFAYGLCTRRIRTEERQGLDLSHWTLAFNGAETVHADTIEKFTSAFAPYGFRREAFYPGYGLAEATLLVSGGQKSAGPVIRSFKTSALAKRQIIEALGQEDGVSRLVGCGHSAEDQQIIIVNPERFSACKSDEVGEICVAGPSVTDGYWQRANETKLSFVAGLNVNEQTSKLRFLRTGDLGFIHRGELFIVGRLKDLIIIHGRNYYPSDIEDTIMRSCPIGADRRVAAFSAEVSGEEKLVVAIEIVRNSDRASVDRLYQTVHENVAQTYGIQVYKIVCVKKGQIPRTTSGKLRRQACAEVLLSPNFNPLSEWFFAENLGGQTLGDSAQTARSAEAIENWLAERIAVRLGTAVGTIDVRKSLASFGLDSVDVLGISGDLAFWLGREVSPTLAYEHPTIADMAQHLGGYTQECSAVSAKPTAASEPIAITGISCRFPKAASADLFWQLLRNGTDAISEVPQTRWNMERFYSPDGMRPGTMNTRWGGFLSDIEQFDAAFFQVSPREATLMDPQQRFLLEVAWEALEDAGEVADRLSKKRCGVFLGISSSEYGTAHQNDVSFLDAYATTGNALSIAANRISYLFDLRGPSIAVDTACSSSLVAVHLACQSISSGECDVAIVGGSNLMLSPAVTISFSRGGATSPDGRCKPFDAGANGIVRGEGVGLIVLKPLSRALADADQIYAMIVSTAVNQDGRSNGIAAPNPAAQEAVLREAYRKAGICPGQVQYVETHGTGTFLGDPIEAKALGNVFAVDRLPGDLCRIGSAKSNIGHLEAAAGIASLIKVALSMRHRELPPSLHYNNPNPHIPFDKLLLRVQNKLEPWPESRQMVAGISAFGFGGTNAHVVLSESPKAASSMGQSSCKKFEILPISAKSPAALRSMAERYRELLAQMRSTSGADFGQLCAAASRRRAHHDHRLAIVGSSIETAIDRLSSFLREEPRSGLSWGKQVGSRRPKLVFVCSGYGGQWWGMGNKLLKENSVFKDSMVLCAELLREHSGCWLLDEFGKSKGDSRLGGNHVEITQTSLFCMQVALADMWRSQGVVPDAVVGHSFGEIAAAHISGFLSLNEAVRICFHRSRLLQQALEGSTKQGTMVSAHMPAADAYELLAHYKDVVSVAAHNGPSSLVLSGMKEPILEIVKHFEQKGILYHILDAPGAGHSPLMAGVEAELVKALGRVSISPGQVAFYSTVTGKRVTEGELDAPYWGRNVRQTVLFADAVEALRREGHDQFLELNAHPILASSIADCFPVSEQPVILPSLRIGQDDRAVVLRSLGTLYTGGRSLNWQAVYPGNIRYVRQPAYPWQHEPFWAKAGAAGIESSPRASHHSVHPLLGRRCSSAEPCGGQIWEVELEDQDVSYIRDYRVGGRERFPVTGYLELVSAAAAELHGEGAYKLWDVMVQQPFFLTGGQRCAVQTVLTPISEDRSRFRIASSLVGSAGRRHWKVHATGYVQVCGEDAIPIEAIAKPEEPREASRIDVNDFYETVSMRGVEYGPSFRVVQQLWRHGQEAVARVQLPEILQGSESRYVWHPALLDACSQVLGAVVFSAADRQQGSVLAELTSIEEAFVFHRPTPTMWSIGRLMPSLSSCGAFKGEVRLVDQYGNTLLKLKGCETRQVDDPKRLAAEDPATWLYEMEWRAKRRESCGLEPVDVATTNKVSWLILEDSLGIGRALADVLREKGIKCVRVACGFHYSEDTQNLLFRARPGQIDDLRRVLDIAFSPTQLQCAVAIHMWSLNVVGSEDSSTEGLTTAHALTCDTLLGLFKEISYRMSDRPPRLWLTTRGAQPFGSKHVGLSEALQTPTWGFGRSLSLEFPAYWGGVVDLDTEASPEQAAQTLCEEILTSDGEDQVAFRGADRLVARLVRSGRNIRNLRPVHWRRDGTYLLTGAYGRIGPSIARWMVLQGAHRLILLARTPLPPRSKWGELDLTDPIARRVGLIQDLEALGASVHIATVDVGDEDAFGEFLNDFSHDNWPPIRGVIHAAGIFELRTIEEMDSSAQANIFRAKLFGSWNLHRWLKDCPLDFFVLFSSFSAMLTLPFLTHYAAANMFLDALAHYRRTRGLKALSVNWGLWGGPGVPAHFLLPALETFSPDQALAVLEDLLGSDLVQIGVTRIDWERSDLDQRFAKKRVLSCLRATQEEQVRDVIGVQESPADIRERILAAPKASRQQLLTEFVCCEIARTLQLPVRNLDPQVPLSAVGIDSLTGIELTRKFEATLKVNIPARTLLSGPTISQLVERVLGEWG
jgi:acyl transferase domain-containing protein/acyl-CoA synthetase (AMP-forming)/AMP-acid ligase II/acyl carrier protein